MQIYRSVDLHSHSTFSDGVLDPKTLAQRAASRGVDLWALTDHDEVSGIALARATAQSLEMDFVAGVEVSVTWGSRTVHIVGLGVDETNPCLLAGLEQTRRGRHLRGREIGEKLLALGIPGAFEGALALAGNEQLLSRTHFARFLVNEGYVKNLQAVFEQYLGDGGPADVRIHWAHLEEALEWIHTAGGVAVLAHPGRYGFGDLKFDALVQAFQANEGLGIEINTGSHQPHERAYYAQVARDYGLLGSCGSDFHGPGEGRHDLGSMPALPVDIEPVWHALSIESS